MVKLISLLVPCRRPHQLAELLQSIEDTAGDTSSVEIVVKIDDDMPECAEFLDREISKRPFTIKYICSPRLGGVFTLWVGLEQALEMSDPDSYFVMVLTDEARFQTKNWDDRLREYIDIFPDGVFRLRISNLKFVNYSDEFLCNTMPESFAIFTRKWLMLTEGLTNRSYGSDIYQQGIAFHLGLGLRSYNDLWHEGALFRDVPARDIELGGIEFGRDISPADSAVRSLYGRREWLRMMRYREQRHMTYLARRIYLYVWAHENNIPAFRFARDDRKSTLRLIEAETGRMLNNVSFRPPRLPIAIHNLRLRLLLFPSDMKQICGEFAGIFRKQRTGARPEADELSMRSSRPFHRIEAIIRLLMVPVDILFRPIDAALSIPPAGLNRLSAINPLGFGARFRRTGYIQPDPDEMKLAAREIMALRTRYRDQQFSVVPGKRSATSNPTVDAGSR